MVRRRALRFVHVADYFLLASGTRLPHTMTFANKKITSSGT
jgi:hypothetical protein